MCSLHWLEFHHIPPVNFLLFLQKKLILWKVLPNHRFWWWLHNSVNILKNHCIIWCIIYYILYIIKCIILWYVTYEKCWTGWGTSWNQDRWEKHQQPPIGRWYHSNGRKWRGIKEPLDEGEGGEWKRWLKTKYLKKLRSWHPLPLPNGK